MSNTSTADRPAVSDSLGDRVRQNNAPSWILSARLDLLLIIGTPILLVPAVIAARADAGVRELVLLVTAIAAIGHHLPGMLRAYGDAALFRRFRVRFIAAPITFLLVAMMLDYSRNATKLLVLFWGTWHFLMQSYGFARIYDAKSKSFSNLTAWLDYGLCVSWFITFNLFDLEGFADSLLTLYASGLPLLPPRATNAFCYGWAIVTGLITVAFIGHHVLRFIEGKPVSYSKLMMLGAHLGLLGWVTLAMDDYILALGVFAIAHDIQYLAIVWEFNRRRMTQLERSPGLLSALFRPERSMIILYIGLVTAYGFLELVDENYDGKIQPLALLLTVSTLLHYYYDGFIWKVRERSNQDTLGLSAENTSGTGFHYSSAVNHVAKWLLFGTPVVLLVLADHQRPPLPVECLNVISISPRSTRGHKELGTMYVMTGQFERAVPHLKHRTELKPNDADAWYQLGAVLIEMGRTEEAASALKRAVDIQPDYPEAQKKLDEVQSDF
ncbi:MAG: tetratricopeptide repeat protein [Planctomycetaceae bacterium]|nr:tetratricopeptide repeat protein [Planctomycetaceae bacterium]